MQFVMPDFSLALPEILLMGMSCVVLLVDLFFGKRSQIITYITIQISLLITLMVVILQYYQYPIAVITFNNSYILDKLAITLKIFILLTSMFAFVYARDYIEQRQIKGEYYILGMFCVLGMLVMASAYSLLMIFLGLELLSLPLYTMIALHKESREAVEAAMKYFVMGALASGLLLYGMSLIYGVTGSIDLNTIASLIKNVSYTMNPVLLCGLVFMVVGLVFKMGAVPFHMWVPDVYHGAPTSVTLFIASSPKLAAFGILVRILVEAMPAFQGEWQHLLIVIAILSMFFGNLLAIAQTNIKRMFAYSAIAHMGYSLLGILAGPYSTEGYSASMFYIMSYAVMATGAFAILIILSRSGMDADKLEDLRGLNARQPWLAFMMLLLLFSMAGIPPTVGFFAKFGLLEALVEAHLVWLAALALVFAIVGAYYYLRVVMLMYFEEPHPELAHVKVKTSPDIWIAVSLNGLAMLVAGLLPSNIIDLCRISFLQ